MCHDTCDNYDFFVKNNWRECQSFKSTLRKTCANNHGTNKLLWKIDRKFQKKEKNGHMVNWEDEDFLYNHRGSQIKCEG